MEMTENGIHLVIINTSLFITHTHTHTHTFLLLFFFLLFFSPHFAGLKQESNVQDKRNNKVNVM